MNSKCDRCGEVAMSLDVGFSPGVHAMKHDCGGTWRVSPSDSDFDPLTPPAAARWWMQRFVEQFVIESTARIEQGNRQAAVPRFVGALEYTMRLTREQGDALLAVLRGFTPKQWKSAREADGDAHEGAPPDADGEPDTDSVRRGDHLRDEAKDPRNAGG